MLCALLVIISCIIFNNNILPVAKLLFMLFIFGYIILSILNILFEVSKLEYFLKFKGAHIEEEFFSNLGFVVVKKGEIVKHGLVNLGFDDNKRRFRTNYYISSVIMRDDFQSGNHKDKSSQ